MVSWLVLVLSWYFQACELPLFNRIWLDKPKVEVSSKDTLIELTKFYSPQKMNA